MQKGSLSLHSQLPKQTNSLHMLIVTLCEKIGHNNHLTLSEWDEISHLKSRDIYLLYSSMALKLDIRNGQTIWFYLKLNEIIRNI